ncbi:MAG: hypothetical protein JXL97_19475 [Bacteroidales bacterium]|nr:hypothetical protein [Bacteroidales bacterium]
MKRIISLTVFLILLSLSLQISAQIGKGGCSDFKNYKQMKDDRDNLKDKEFFEPITAYGSSKAEAKYNTKVLILRELIGNQMYLDNPRVDSVLAEFAGEVVFLLKDEYDVFKTKKKYRAENGLYTCMVYRTKYNPDLIEFLQYYINTFIKYSVVFIVNPYIERDGDAPTKELYNSALNGFHTMCLQPKYKFDNVIELRMLERAKLQPKPADYNPAEGFQSYATGNKYLDFVTSITNNANRSRQVDIVFSMDTITITKVPNTDQRIVNFHLIGYNTNTATEILIYDSKYTVDGASNDYDAVDLALKEVFARDIDNYMYDIAKRYSSYLRDGMLFSLKISDSLLTQNIELSLEQSMLDCKLFAESSINPAVWRNNGQQIGKSWEGRTYLLDRLRLKLMMIDLLKNAGVTNFNVDIAGTDFIVTPMK